MKPTLPPEPLVPATPPVSTTITQEPQIDYSITSDIEAEEGGFATLKCEADGIPTPTISWQRGSTIVSNQTIRLIGRSR